MLSVRGFGEPFLLEKWQEPKESTAFTLCTGKGGKKCTKKLAQV